MSADGQLDFGRPSAAANADDYALQMTSLANTPATTSMFETDMTTTEFLEYEKALKQPCCSKSRALLFSAIAAVCFVLAAGTTVALVLLLNNDKAASSSSSADNSLSPTSPPPPEGFALPPPAPPGQLLTVKDPACDCTVARSYDGFPWEPTPRNDRATVPVRCDADGVCYILTASPPSNATSIDIPAPLTAVSPRHRAARLLSQATFGATIETITATASTYGDDVARWVKDQMAIPRTSARAYVRQRSNGRYFDGAFQTGHLTKACDYGARWHQFLFNFFDNGKTLTVTTGDAPGRYSLYIDGELRAELSKWYNETHPGSFPASSEYKIYCVEEGLGNRIRLKPTSSSASVTCGRINTYDSPYTITNPAIEFGDSGARISGANALQTVTAAEVDFTPVNIAKNGVFVVAHRTPGCVVGTDPAGNTYMLRDGEFFRFDPRIRLITNTVDQPSTGLPEGATCPTAPLDYQNARGCTIRPECGSPPVFTSVNFDLDASVLRTWYNDDISRRRIVYSVRGLRLEGEYATSPCTGGRSRWVNVGAAGSCAETPGLNTATKAAITNALTATTDKANSLLRDVVVSDAGCDATNTATIGARVAADSFCWQHVHPDEYTVRDVTDWNVNHPGNAAAAGAGNPNPIDRFARDGGTELYYPASHPMSRWAEHRVQMPAVGRLGDSLAFGDIASQLKTIDLALAVGALAEAPVGGAIACGSYDEVMNKPEYGEYYPTYVYNRPPQRYLAEKSVDSPMKLERTTEYGISNVMHKANDQLRQRVAFSLSNFIVLATGPISGYRDKAEGFLKYYDIFTRNAFGSFATILKDVSYHRYMGSYLTYEGSRAYASSGTFPDENYAREIMQLFSIGLVELNDDGTPKRDAAGNELPTYGQEDIVDYARVWTGFEGYTYRRNLIGTPEQDVGADAMLINPVYHDRMPKLRLASAGGGYIGDTYPICDELPGKPWLNKGARYTLVGPTSGSSYLDGNEHRLEPLTPVSDGSSGLFEALCGRMAPGSPCTFPAAPVLQETVPCVGNQECDAGEVVTVKIIDPIGNVSMYYRANSVPCVRLAFFNGGETVSSRYHRTCANPVTPAAMPLCCSPTNTRSMTVVPGICNFIHEKVSHTEAVARCSAAGAVLCDHTITNGGWGRTCLDRSSYWANSNCSIKAQIYASGRVGVVDDIALSTEKVLQKSSNNFFRVVWNSDPLLAIDGVCPAGCDAEPTADGVSCICSTRVVDSVVYTSPEQLINATSADLLANVHIGATAPSMYGAGVYAECTTDVCKSVANTTGATIWLHSGDGGSFSARTIFALPAFRLGGRPRFILNRVSTVYLGDGDAYSFRNAPTFTRFVGFGKVFNADYDSLGMFAHTAHDEVSALLEMLVEHDATAPFVCWRLIQNLVTSNPSPRYMEKVVKAFRTGSVTTRDGTVHAFSNTYGDLGAAIFAILTDREARSDVLLADTSFGMVNDPLMLLHRVLRGLDYQSPIKRELQLQTSSPIAMQPLTAPSVFSFYLPEYQPSGRMLDEGLFSPAAQLATPPIMVSLLNGIHSLMDYGLTHCASGFGDDLRTYGCGDPKPYADGYLDALENAATKHAASTAADIVDELSLVLTGGRILPGMATHTTLLTDFERVDAESGRAAAIRRTAKIMIAAPEFYTTNVAQPTERSRAESSTTSGSTRPFKALVMIFLEGGLDSFAALEPLTCDAGVRAEYESVRGGAAMDTGSLLPVTNNGGDPQPCSTFGMHPAFANVKQAYDDGDALWFANIGALVEPTTLEQYRKKRVGLPVSLYSHSSMQLHGRTCDPGSLRGSGVLARIADVLSTTIADTYSLVMQSVRGATRAMSGTKVSYDIVGTGTSIETLNNRDDVRPVVNKLLARKEATPLTDLFGDQLDSALNSTEKINQQLATVSLLNSWSGSGLTFRQIKRVAELIIGARGDGQERGIYYATATNFDTHNSLDLNGAIGAVDTPLGQLIQELKLQNVWDDTTIVLMSEFGRTLKNNGKGTDHAWGGNTVILGGGLRGERVLGQYINKFSDDGPQIIDKGRVLPTMPWEAMWHGIAQWFGVADEHMPAIFPNWAKFDPSTFYTQADLYE
ncbi:twin-arginine translocation domain-containing protein [Thecamonas trahens ATCC 50062]|uniref:Twin-arginine translocation domain-containing protein n=1 Tax=Thecamonas trahens ATCC 50062 TaxID=461836 RepID=A0A0L0DM43_THETB|nr:twin-arginine translocation domain-containing protein [Thecamonas trahens ATCC 50062]KNC53335.1 twin-arginine translocation domain-containing protein [Thecamonas trahens ATCC 50062]|eukprot:XP_013754590.1 twin-arginine translocation domain-containing protein [Thecamonas trahens ATCC 50062]